MRLSFVLLFFLSFSYTSNTQPPCPNPQSQIDLWGNGLKTIVLGAGDFGWDLQDAYYVPNYNPDSINPSTIFVAGLWYGGIDPGGNLVMKESTYRSNAFNSPFFTGPLNSGGVTDTNNCLNWDRSFKVNAIEISNFLDDLEDGILDSMHQAVVGWPGRGNPLFSSIWGFDLPITPQGLAPFYDVDGNGLYNPMAGDYPVVQLQGKSPFIPDLHIWQVVNDQGGGAPGSFSDGDPLPAEIQISYFVFNCPDQPLIHNTMFSSHKLINRANEPIDSFYLAMWVDFDLGCHTDDYVGCNPQTNTFYAYNKSNLDKAQSICSGVPTFDINPPAQAVSFLNKEMDYFIPFYNSVYGSPPSNTVHPGIGTESYNYLSGSWKDGTKLTIGGEGNSSDSSAIETNFAFPGNPNNQNEWSMHSENLPGRDPRCLGSHYLGTLLPGQTEELTIAWSYHRGPGLNHLENVNLMLQEVPLLHDAYENNFDDICSTSVSSSSISNDQSIILYPNPASGEVFLNWSRPQTGGLNVYDITGKLIYRKRISGEAMNSFNTANWPEGMYFVVFSDGTTITSKKLEVLRSN